MSYFSSRDDFRLGVWSFTCKCLHVLEQKCVRPRMILSRSPAPGWNHPGANTQAKRRIKIPFACTCITLHAFAANILHVADYWTKNNTGQYGTPNFNQPLTFILLNANTPKATSLVVCSLLSWFAVIQRNAHNFNTGSIRMRPRWRVEWFLKKVTIHAHVTQLMYDFKAP